MNTIETYFTSINLSDFSVRFIGNDDEAISWNKSISSIHVEVVFQNGDKHKSLEKRLPADPGVGQIDLVLEACLHMIRRRDIVPNNVVEISVNAMVEKSPRLLAKWTMSISTYCFGCSKQKYLSSCENVLNGSIELSFTNFSSLVSKYTLTVEQATCDALPSGVYNLTYTIRDPDYSRLSLPSERTPTQVIIRNQHTVQVELRPLSDLSVWLMQNKSNELARICEFKCFSSSISSQPRSDSFSIPLSLERSLVDFSPIISLTFCIHPVYMKPRSVEPVCMNQDCLLGVFKPIVVGDRFTAFVESSSLLLPHTPLRIVINEQQNQLVLLNEPVESDESVDYSITDTVLKIKLNVIEQRVQLDDSMNETTRMMHFVLHFNTFGPFTQQIELKVVGPCMSATWAAIERLGSRRLSQYKNLGFIRRLDTHTSRSLTSPWIMLGEKNDVHVPVEGSIYYNCESGRFVTSIPQMPRPTLRFVSPAEFSFITLLYCNCPHQMFNPYYQKQYLVTRISPEGNNIRRIIGEGYIIDSMTVESTTNNIGLKNLELDSFCSFVRNVDNYPLLITFVNPFGGT